MKNTITFLFVISLLFSCNALDFSEVKFPVNVTLPVADFDLTDSTIFSWAGIEDYITVGEDDVLQVSTSVDMNLSSVQELQELFSLSNHRFTLSMTLGGVTPVPFEMEIPQTVFSEVFDMGEGRSANTILLQAGLFDFVIENASIDFSGVQCMVPQLTKNDIPLILSPGEKVDLSGYRLVLSNSKMNFVLSGKIKANAGADLSNIVVRLALTNLSMQEGVGFFGRTEIVTDSYSDTFDSGITDFFQDCNYYLADPKLTLKINNTFGLPVLAQIKTLKINDKEISLKNEIGCDRVLITAEDITSYTLSNASTQSGRGLSLALSENVSTYEIVFNIIANPTAEDVGDPDYIPPTVNKIGIENTVEAQSDLVIPFYCTFENLPFSQDIDLGLDDIDESDYEYVKIGVTCENQLPLGVSFSLYAVSQFGEEVPLFDQDMELPESNAKKPGTSGFEPGVLNETNPLIRTIQGPLVKEFLNADKLKLVFNGRTTHDAASEQGAVKFYSPSSLKLRLICNLKGDL